VRKTCPLLCAVATLVVACRTTEPPPRSRPRPATTRSVRITMEALHRAGGVPPGWRFTPPAGDATAGERVFRDAGCDSCHAVNGKGGGPGPDLSGMGSHHPPEYFIESILNPDAVLVEGPGYIDPQGHSTMPAYPDLTLAQLADVVAYVQSLGGGPAMAPGPVMSASLPPAPASATSAYYVQTYEVQQGKLEAFQEWFRTEGAARFLAHDGLTAVDTWVDTTRQGPPLISVWSFRDMEALNRFIADPSTQALGEQFDSYIGPHPHLVFRTPPVYRVPGLSAPQ